MYLLRQIQSFTSFWIKNIDKDISKEVDTCHCPTTKIPSYIHLRDPTTLLPIFTSTYIAVQTQAHNK